MSYTNKNQETIPAHRGHKSAVTIALATAVFLIALFLGIFEGEWETAVIMFVLVALLSSIVPYFKEDGTEFKEGDSKNAFRLFVNIPMGILFVGIIVFAIAYNLKICEYPHIIAFIKWLLLVLAVFVTAVSMFITVSVYSSTNGRLGYFKKLAHKVVTRQSGATLMSFFTQFLVVTFLLSMSLAVADGFGQCGDDIPAALLDVSEEIDKRSKDVPTPRCKNPNGMDKYVILFETESSTPLLKLSKFDNHIYLQRDFDKEGLALICKEEKVAKDNINKKDICKGNYKGIYILAEMDRLVDALYNKERCDIFFAMEAFPNLNKDGTFDGNDLVNLAMAEKRRVAIEQELHKMINERLAGEAWRPWPRIYLSTSKNDKDEYPIWHNKFFKGQGEKSNEVFDFIIKDNERPSKKKHVAVLLTPISMEPAANRIGYEHVPESAPANVPENNTFAVNDTSEKQNEETGEIKGQKEFIDYLYFMIYTITTTGYGDLHPKGEFARLLVSIANLIELFFGVIFINVLIAHGVALRYSGQFQQEDKKTLSEIKEDTRSEIKEDTSKLVEKWERSDNETNRNRETSAQVTDPPNPDKA